MARFKWKAYEEQLTQLALASIGEVMDEHPDESFYAAAFHGFYIEEEGQIGVPLLGANTAEAIDEGYSRWGAPDWYWDDIQFVDDEFNKLHEAIQEEACRTDIDHWYKTHSRYMDAMIKVAKSLSAKLKSKKQASKDFVVIVSDEESEDADVILRRCISKTKYKKLFPDDDEFEDYQPTPDGEPVDASWEGYLADLEEHEDEVLKMGQAALPMLLHAMNHRTQKFAAAGLLGLLRIADPKVIELLRKGAATGKDSHYQYAVSLAILGDFEFLFELGENPKTREIVRSGIEGLYRYQVNRCVPYLPLDYRPLDRYFDNKCKPKIKDLWAGSRSIRSRDLKEAFRGLKSPHAEIRIHAAIVLGKDHIPRGDAKKILPMLISQLSDKNTEVRRRTLNAISQWGRVAKPHVRKIRKLIDDPDWHVSNAAYYCVEDIMERR